MIGAISLLNVIGLESAAFVGPLPRAQQETIAVIKQIRILLPWDWLLRNKAPNGIGQGMLYRPTGQNGFYCFFKVKRRGFRPSLAQGGVLIVNAAAIRHASVRHEHGCL